MQPPPVEERDRCSREAWGGGAPAKLVGGPCPTLDMHPQPLTTCHSPGPTDSRNKTRRRQEGSRQAEATPLEGSHPAVCSLPTALHIFAALGAGEASLQGQPCCPRACPEAAPDPAALPSLLPETSCYHIRRIPATSLGHLHSRLLSGL